MTFRDFSGNMFNFCALLLLAVLSGCAEVEPNPKVDNQVRLVVLSPALADTLRDLGHAELIVGRQRFDRFTDQSVPVVGDLTGIDYERLLLAQPTHIVTQETQAGLPAELISMADERGWTIVTIPLLSLEDTIESISSLDDLVSARASRAPDLQDRFRKALDETVPLGSTAIVASSSPLALIGPGAFHWEAVQSLGGQPVPDRGLPYLTIDAEGLLAMNPDTILVLAPGLNGDSELSSLLGAAAVVGLDAVRDNRVIVIGDEKCMLPSTALLAVIEQIRAQAQRIGPPPGS